MAKENLSDEEYLDSLLKNLSQDGAEAEEVMIDENNDAGEYGADIAEEGTDIDAELASLPMPETFDLEAMVNENTQPETISEAELEAAAEESLNQLLQESEQEMDFTGDISIQQLIEREQGISLEDETAQETAELTGQEMSEAVTFQDEAPAEEAAMEDFGLGFDFAETGQETEPEEVNLDFDFSQDSEKQETETEPEEINLGIDMNLGMDEPIDEAFSVDMEEEASRDELLDSLSSIVREIHEDAVPVRSDLSGEDKLNVKPAKKPKKEKMPKARKSKPEKKKIKKENKFWKKLQDIFFKVELVDLEEEAEQESKLKQEKEEKKKAKAIEKEQLKKQKQEEKKAADAKKRELAQAKKKEKDRKLQEKKAKKAELEAALGPEERVKLKPAFMAFTATVIAVMAIAVVLMSGRFSYQNSIKTAERSLAVKNYEEAYRVLAGVELKDEDMLLYQKIELLVRLDKQYDAYVNFRSMEKPREALNALMQGMTIYYANTLQAEELEIEAEADALKETLMYSLVNDFGLNEDKVMEICAIADTNEYTKEIEFYSANLIQ